jgi:NTP pyrophosphatase (non-canonical NTP hydrolase)
MAVALQRDPRGDAWQDETLNRLMNRLRQNVDELALAIQYGIDVEEKAADVANYALFIWHVWRRNS